jgi:hypothetical protein
MTGLRPTLSVVALLLMPATSPAQDRAATATTPNQALAEMDGEIRTMMQRQPIDNAAYSALVERSRARVQAMIERDELRTAGDFYVASRLATDAVGFYETRRVAHELALVALVLGHPDALSRVALTWDGLNLSVGRGQRIGSYKRDGVPTDMDAVPAPEVVRALFSDPASARRRAAGRPNDAELQGMRDEDQADRTDPIDMAKLERMRVNDPVRRDRVLRMNAVGAPTTGRVFHNAATVLQHGRGPDDFRLAHELTIAAVALGDTSAAWLLSRSYDRLLLRMGHRQRLNTQYGGPQGLPMPLDTTAVNDRIRLALGSRRLADAARPPGST